MFSKKLFTIIIFSLLAVAYSLPVFAQKSYCWPKKDCENNNGIWVVTAESKDPQTGCQQSPAQYAFCYPKETPVNLQVPIGMLNQASSLTQYIPAVYNYLVAIVSIVAIVMIMVGGLRYLTAGGNPSAVTSAKETILGAVIGLFLTLGSYVILQTINPALVKLELPRIKMVAPASISPWCPDTGEFVGKFECGTPYTRASTPTLPVSAGASCTGSSCAKSPDTGCARIGDLIGVDPAQTSIPKPICIPTFLLKACPDLTAAAKKYCTAYTKAECSRANITDIFSFESQLQKTLFGGTLCDRPTFGSCITQCACQENKKTLDEMCGRLWNLYSKDKQKAADAFKKMQEVIQKLQQSQ